MARTNATTRFSTELTSEMSATSLNCSVLTTSGLASPAYLVVDYDDEDKAEVVLFDGTFDGTTFRTTSLANRYLTGSAAPSGIVHETGAKVISSPLGQHHDEVHDALETHATLSSSHGATSLPTPSTLVSRDSAGRFRAVSPSNTADVATKGYVDATVPVGGIIMWSGSVGSIPPNWQLCDGSNGTPDLRNRFVVGAGSTFTPGATGGSTSHAHSGPSHTHGFSATSSSDSHTHNIPVSADTSNRGITGGGALVSPTSHDHGTTGSDNHSHSVSGTSGSGGSANTSTADLRPPYLALAYIQRIV